MNFKQAVGSENIYGVFNVFVDVPLKNLSLHIPDELYLDENIIGILTGKTYLKSVCYKINYPWEEITDPL